MRASIDTTLPMLWPCSPPGRPQPQIRSSIWVGSSSGTLSRTFVTTWAARSSGRTSTSEPFRARPMGDLPYATITASVMGTNIRRSRRSVASEADDARKEAGEQQSGDDEGDDRVRVDGAERDDRQDQRREIQGARDLEVPDVHEAVP